MAKPINQQRNPSQFRTGVRRVVNFAANAPDESVEAGRNWYPAVHEATAKGSKEIGIHSWHGAGIVAALSPGMDFESRNIHALGEIRNLGESDWDMVHRSHQEATKNRQWNRQNQDAINEGRASRRNAGRQDFAREMLVERAPAIAQAPDNQLLKARSILHGEDPHAVLNPIGSPKTNAFAHNIHDPDSWEHVTIDGRQADIIDDTMRGWQDTSRGVGGSRTAKNPPGGYSDRENVMRTATMASHTMDSRLKDASPADLQAVTWVEGKRIEMSFPMATGGVRKQGPQRTGQSYQRAQKLYG